MSRSLADSRRWLAQGTALWFQALDALADEEYDEPSQLPGWTRKHLVAHLWRNAEGLRNLVHWARTGEKTRMYASMAHRAADIESGSALPARTLWEHSHAASDALLADLDQLTDRQWDAQLLSTRGQPLSAADIPWLRDREVLIHAVDLGVGVTFADLPVDFLASLVDDIVAKRAAGPGPAVLLRDTGSARLWPIPGEGDPVEVSGPLHHVAGWLAGRGASGLTVPGDGGLPTLAAWL